MSPPSPAVAPPQRQVPVRVDGVLQACTLEGDSWALQRVSTRPQPPTSPSARPPPSHSALRTPAFRPMFVFLLRLSGAVTKGYEEDVGTRTSFYGFTAFSLTQSLFALGRRGFQHAPLGKVSKEGGLATQTLERGTQVRQEGERPVGPGSAGGRQGGPGLRGAGGQAGSGVRAGPPSLGSCGQDSWATRCPWSPGHPLPALSGRHPGL